MTQQPQSSHDDLLASLHERAKELNCLYLVEEIISDKNNSQDEIFAKIVEAIPLGFSYPEACQTKIICQHQEYKTQQYETPCATLTSEIIVADQSIGFLEVSYHTDKPSRDEGPFLKEEKKLINTITERLSQSILHKQMESLFKKRPLTDSNFSLHHDWRSIVELLAITDQQFYFNISRRLLNHLASKGREEARLLINEIGGSLPVSPDTLYTAEIDTNRPLKKRIYKIDPLMAEKIFALAESILGDEQIFSLVQKWVKENKLSFLVKVLDDNRSSLGDIIDAIVRFKNSQLSEQELPFSTMNAINVSLIRRFFSRRLDFINIAKTHITIDDFYDLTKRLIFTPASDGKVGGKGAGLFIAMNIIKEEQKNFPELAGIKAPKTWYIASDGVIDFINHNHLQELREYKYKELSQIRADYENIVQLFKNSSFSAEMIKGLSLALDDFGTNPLVIRSSSLLEDSFDAAFSGKYKSLFIANQGTKDERLEALIDAIAEVYASMFHHDPIEYRAERGLLDYQEEMGILIQEVVGTKVGHYLLPSFGGVAFSRNEFRWSPRIKREDNLVRIVPGLGTRAVDRLGNDYPVLLCPGQPQLRVNTTNKEIICYAPKYLDVINLNTNSFETMACSELIQQHGHEYPGFEKIFSLVDQDVLKQPSGLVDIEHNTFVVTFDGLVNNTPFLKTIKSLLNILEKHFQKPIDIEFASDGKNFYLLQCRSQSSNENLLPEKIPTDVDKSRVLFSANKFVSNGTVPPLTHIVYVDPLAYDSLKKLGDLKDVARVVGILNDRLPKRQFILMGPGRWGSRGDIKMGVAVSYADINNTAMLIEMAFKKGNYLPDLSFGTHFFQDLVEASIRYLPLYPDDDSTIFNRDFFEKAENTLGRHVPKFTKLASVIKVIDVALSAPNMILRIATNADECKALAYLTEPSPVKSNP